MPVALEDIDGESRQLLGRHAAIDAGVLQGAIEPCDVLIELEKLVAEAARHVIDALAAGETPVEDRDLGLARRYEATSDVANPLFHRTRPPDIFWSAETGRRMAAL